MRNRDSVVHVADRVSQMARLLIENADRIVERAGLSPRLMIDGNPESELRGIEVFPDRRLNVSPESGRDFFTTGPVRGILAAGQLLFGGGLDGERIVSIASAPSRFKYGPFRNRPMRSKPSAQRRQRLARRIERANRK